MRNKKIIVILSLLFILLSMILKQLNSYLYVVNGFLILAAVIASFNIIKNAFQALIYKIIGIELLVSIAVIGSLIIGEYFESAVVSFLFVLGAYLEAKTLEKTRRSIQELLDLVPLTVRVIRNREVEMINPKEVILGDTVIIKSGEKVAVDGQIRRGKASINQAAITGESIPVTKSESDEVYSGTIVETGYIEVITTKIGKDTTLAKILELVEEAQSSKAKSQKFIEKFAKYYTPAIIILSSFVYLITRDIELTLTLLVISCPGAMVISAPVSLIAGIGNGAKKGVLIKGGEYLEKAGRIEVVCFDKTGTLTVGRPVVTNVITSSLSKEELLYKASVVEKASEHHLAKAILNEASKYYKEIETATDIEVFLGKGIKGDYLDETIWIGNIKLALEYQVEIPEAFQSKLMDEQSVETNVLVFNQKEVLGIISIADEVREDAYDLVYKLKHVGIKKVIMLTGDHEQAARSISNRLGIDEFYANLLPHQKLEIIKTLKEKYRVAMIGDGINDAPSLVLSDLGISIGGSTDVAIESSDIVLMSGKLNQLPYALKLSKKTMNNLKQNLYFSVFVVMTLLIGVLTKNVFMSLGMFIHELSVLIVILNAMRLTKFNVKR